MTEYVLIMTTTEKKEDAQIIADILIEKHLAACVQISGPITSVYRWQGNVEKSVEHLCFIKTEGRFSFEVEETIKKFHKYETPEIICLPIISGSKEYFSWMSDLLK